MRFENMGIENRELPINILDHLMEENGFVRAGQWDYERVTYDYKFESMSDGAVYYLRVQGHAIEGAVDTSHAVIKTMVPLLGRHYYPHGVEYEGEQFPKNIVQASAKQLEKVKAAMDDAIENAL